MSIERKVLQPEESRRKGRGQEPLWFVTNGECGLLRWGGMPKVQEVRGVEGRPEPDDKALRCPCHSHLVSLMETSLGREMQS